MKAFNARIWRELITNTMVRVPTNGAAFRIRLIHLRKRRCYPFNGRISILLIRPTIRLVEAPRAEMATAVEQGANFGSYVEFENCLKEYKEKNYCDFFISDCRTLEAAKKRYPNRVANASPDLKYYFIKLSCVHGGSFKKKKDNLGQRKTSSMRQGCTAFIYVKLSDDATQLVITEMSTVHNHQLSKELFSSLPSQRSLTLGVQQEILELLDLKANKKLVQEKYCNLTQKKITLRDLSNIKVRGSQIKMRVSSKKGKSMSEAQLTLIVSAMENDPAMNEVRVGQSFAKDDKKKKWAELTPKLNALEGAVKTSEKWQKCWSDKKNDLKRKVERIIEDIAKPGGSEERLTRLEERIMSLSGWSEQITEDELYQRDSNSESAAVEADEAVDNSVEVSASKDAEQPSSSLSAATTLITLGPAMVASSHPAAVISNTLTRKRKRDEESAINSPVVLNPVVEQSPTACINQPDEPMARKPYETASLKRIATACEINNCKLQEQTVTLQQIAAVLPKPEEATALKRIAAAYEINNCKMQEQTETLQRLTAAMSTKPDYTIALNRIAAACETRANEAVKQTLLLEKIYSTLNK